MTVAASTRTAELIGAMSVFAADRIPAPVRAQAGAALYDQLGALLGATASRYPVIALVRELVGQVGGRPECVVAGTGLRTNATTAALVNGTLAYYCDIESHHPSANVHAIAVVAPAALAVGERCDSSGAAVLAAIVAGIDVTARVSAALGPAEQYARGLHPSTIAGTFGAAAAAGRLLRLDDERLAHALGLASTSTSGLLSWVDDASEQSRPLNIGLAAQAGAQAALLAAAGFHGPADPFGGKYPFGAAYTGRWDQNALLDGIGERFAVSELFFKRNACCVFIPAGIDGLLAILTEEGIAAADIDTVTVRAPQSSFHVIDGNPLRSHNLQYVLAVAATRGHVGFDDILRDRRIDDPAIRRLSERVTLVGDPGIDRRATTGRQSVGSITTVRTLDGREFTRDVEFPLGAAENPLAPADLEAKFRRLTAGVIGAERADAIRAAVVGIEELPSIRTLTDLLASNPITSAL